MGSRGMLTLCAAINSVHWLMTRFIRNNTVFAYNDAKTGAVSTQLMSATKIVGKSRFLPSSLSVYPGRNSALKTYFLASGLNNVFFAYICVNKGADQLSGNHAARAADQHFCFRFIESTLPVLPITEI